MHGVPVGPPGHSVVHDVGFSDAVSDVVDLVKYETSRRGRARGQNGIFTLAY